MFKGWPEIEEQVKERKPVGFGRELGKSFQESKVPRKSD